MKNLLFIVSFSIIFLGCSQSALSVFGKGSVYKKGVEDTTIKSINQNNETHSIINASFLNNIYPDTYDNEYNNFLIGLYIANNSIINIDDNKTISLKLDGKSFDKYKTLEKSNKLYDKIPVKNPYASYYIVSFKKTSDRTTVNLEYKYATFNKVILPFGVK